MQQIRQLIRVGATASLLAATLVLTGSCGDQVTTVDIARIEVTPATASVSVGHTTNLSARVLAAGGEPLGGRPVQWRSLDPAIAEVDAQGSVRGVAPGTTTVEASSNGVSGSASVTVTAGPSIVLNPAQVEFSAVWNGASPGDRTVSVQNGGAGTLGGLAAAVRYDAGAPTGWLAATVGSTAPANLVLSATPGQLPPGDYTAYVDVTSPDASNSPAALTVRLTVLAPAPAIALGTSGVTFFRAVAGSEPAPQTVGVTNAGGGSLTGLALTTSYTAGQPTGWLTASLSGTTAPATISLQTSSASLQPGTYTATVAVSSAAAQNSPQQLSVTLTVTATQPAIGVQPATLTFNGRQAGPSPSAQQVQITNTGGGSLTGIVTSVTFPGGQPTGWLTLSLSSATAPATLTVGVQQGQLAAGTYTATINVAAPGAVNSPRPIAVTLVVGEAEPAIVATPATVTFTSAGEGDPAPAAVAISNGGGGTLGGLAHTITYGQASHSGWLAAQLGGATAPTTLTLTATRGSLPIGTYTATVRVTSADAPPLDIPVTYTIATAPPAAPTEPSAAPIQQDRIQIRWVDESDNEDRFEVERSTDDGATWSATFVAPANSALHTDTGLSSSTTYTYRVRACNAAGCSAYTALVSARTAPAPPVGLTAEVVSVRRIELEWTDDSSDETEFAIARSVDGGVNWPVIATVEGNTTAYADTAVSPATAYLYRVLACRGSSVCSSPSNVVPAVTPSPPEAPSGLVATTASTTRINLRWTDNSTTETEFRIQGRAGTAAFADIGTVAANDTTFAHTGLAPSTTYEYRVRACSDAGCSPYSGLASARTADPPPLAPSAPSGLSATAVDQVTIRLEWNAGGGLATHYHIERSPTGTGNFVEIGNVLVAVRSYQDQTLNPGTRYYYRVRARGPGGYSGYSQVDSATTPVPAPGAPGGLRATAASPTRVDLEWTASGGSIDSYRIMRKTGAGGTYAQAGQVPSGTLAFQNTGLLPSTSYVFRVDACNPSGCVGSNEASVTTPPPAPGVPGNLQAASGGVTRINLTWSAASGVVNTYHVERSTTAGSGFTEVATTPTGTTALADTGLAGGTTYYYRVRARNVTGFSGYSAVATTSTDVPPPSVPGGVTATAVSPTRIDVAWTASTGTVTGYRVLRKTGAGGAYALAGEVPTGTLSFENTGLTPATEYFFRVEACNTGGCSAGSAEASATTPPAAPGAPGNLQAASGGVTRINLTWSAASGVVNTYHVERSTTAGSGFTEVATTPTGTTALADTGLAGGTTYYYRVRARNVTGFSGYSAVATTSTDVPPPSVPGGVTATAVSPTRIDVAWTASTGTVTGYRVLRKTGAGGAYALAGEVPTGTLSFENTGLTPATEYFFRVEACNTGGCSAGSAEASATTPPAAPGAPGNLQAASAGIASINLTWSAASGVVDTYHIERSPTAGGGFVEIATRPAGTTSFADEGLESGTTYNYRVRARNVTAFSEYSAVAAATTDVPPPNAPSDLAATSASTTQINLSWTDNSDDETGFVVQARTEDAEFEDVGSVVANQRTFSHTGLAPSTTYTFRVRACNGAVCSGYSNEVSRRTQDPPPLAPATPPSLTATAASPTRVNLSWGASNLLALTYHIERSTSATGGFAEVASVPLTQLTYQDDGVTGGTTYHYRVRARGIAGYSGYSPVATATTPSPAPAVPTGFAAEAASTSAITLNWSHAGEPAATRFEIHRAPAQDPDAYAPLTTVDGAARSHTNTGLAAATSYHYRIRACAGTECSAWTGSVDATTNAPSGSPSTPSNITGTAVSPTEIRVSWSPQTGHSHYQIRRRRGTGGMWSPSNNVPGAESSYTDTAVSPSSTYQYQVQTCAGNTCSDFSSPVTVSTPSAAVVDIAPPAGGAGAQSSDSAQSRP